MGISLVAVACATPSQNDEPAKGYQWVVRSETNPYHYTYVGKAYATKAEALAALDEHLYHFPWHRPHAEILRVPMTERKTRD